MKPTYTPLNKLSDKLKSYKVKVKVVQKCPPRHTPPKKRYQKLTLKDDCGNTMQGTIFGDDIEVYTDAVLHNGEYEISNAPIKPVPTELRSKLGDYQMNFTGRVSIKPLNLEDCASGPQYRSLSLVPRTHDSSDETVDVLGVLLYMSDVRPVARNEIENQVRDIYIVDASSERPMKISAWNQFATEDSENLPSWSDGFSVVGFTGLCPATNRGLYLKTGPSTAFVREPTGTKADELRYWLVENTQKLRDWQDKCITLNTPNTTRIIACLGVVENKRASTLWQEEKFWVKATMPGLLASEVYAYVACSGCNRRIDAEMGASSCCTHCSGRETQAVSRSNLKTTISDGTGSIRVTAFGNQVEQLLNLSVDEIYSFKLKHGDAALDKKLAAVKNREMLIHVSPTYDLSLSNTLKWVVRAVESVEVGSSRRHSNPFLASAAKSIAGLAETQGQPNSEPLIHYEENPTPEISSILSADMGYRMPHGKSPVTAPSSPLHAIGEDSDESDGLLVAPHRRKSPQKVPAVASEDVAIQSDDEISCG